MVETMPLREFMLRVKRTELGPDRMAVHQISNGRKIHNLGAGKRKAIDALPKEYYRYVLQTDPNGNGDVCEDIITDAYVVYETRDPVCCPNDGWIHISLDNKIHQELLSSENED